MSAPQIIPFHPPAPIELALIREAHHRVANQLSMLANLVQVQVINAGKGPAAYPREQVQGMLREVASKVITVGHLQRRLAEEPGGRDIDLANYLIENSRALIKSLSLESRVGIVHRLGGSCPVKPDQTQPVALIVAEIIMNAVKHAHPTGIPVEISMRCERNAQGRLVVEIEDDGVGFPEGFDPKNGGGAGFRLMRVLAASINADLDISSDSLGARFVLTLPAHMPLPNEPLHSVG
jgi:two-component sensor histidine kinase